jgi:hypothetical protein
MAYTEPLPHVFLGPIADMPPAAQTPQGCLYIIPAIANPATPAALHIRDVAPTWTKIF